MSLTLNKIMEGRTGSPGRLPALTLHQIVAAGLITDSKVFEQNGRNAAIQTTLEDIQIQGATLTFQTSAQSIEVLSTDANDTSAGSGARTVLLEGVDGSFAYITETVTMNGTSAVAVTQNFLRIYKMSVVTRGTYLTLNAGTITAQVVTGSVTMCVIPFDTAFGGVGKQETTHYTVPAGKRAFLDSFLVNTDTSKKVRLAMNTRVHGSDSLTAAPFTGPYCLPFIWDRSNESLSVRVNDSAFYIPEKTDVWFSAIGEATASSVAVNYRITEFSDWTILPPRNC